MMKIVGTRRVNARLIKPSNRYYEIGSPVRSGHRVKPIRPASSRLMHEPTSTRRERAAADG